MRWAAASERLADRIPAKGRVPNWSNDIVMAHLRQPLLALLVATMRTRVLFGGGSPKPLLDPYGSTSRDYGAPALIGAEVTAVRRRGLRIPGRRLRAAALLLRARRVRGADERSLQGTPVVPRGVSVRAGELVALDAYLIVNTGGNHPFFEDAVRRQLEVRNPPGIRALLYVVPELDPAGASLTDQVKYTVGKSFWPGERTHGQGRSWRSRLAAGSMPGPVLHGRGLAGGVRHGCGLPRWPSWVGRAGGARMAGARAVLYEIGEYDQALAAYRNIPAGSTYFADQLYEMVWAYIKQGDWEGALQQTEIFLIAFPEHPYALQLKLDMGHLHMKNTSYEKALAAYETVVDDYTPLQRQLARIEATREDIGTYFERMVAGDALDAGNAALPDFARALLTGNDEVARAVDASRALRSQQSDLDDSRSAAREVDAVLSSSNDAIGTFARGRTGVTRVRDDALGLRIRLLSLELAALDEAAGRRSTRFLEQEQLAVMTAQPQIQDIESASSDRYQARGPGARGTGRSQERQRVVRDLQAEAAATARLARPAGVRRRQRTGRA